MPKGPVVSVIVAAYNAEKYLRRSLDSIQAQSFNDFEVIIVDDGSTDSTPAIADEYAAKDSRFKVIHKTNGGVASARQAGVDAATGKYTIHVDSDDWVESEMLDEMVRYSETEQSDILITDIKTKLPDGKEEYWCQRPDSLDHISVLGQMFGELYGSMWNKLIRKRCYDVFGLRFRKDLVACEDQLLVMTLLAQPVKVSYLNNAFYHYDLSQNPSSFVNNGIQVSTRLVPLELVAEMVDISSVQVKFDNALFKIAYDALFVSKEDITAISTLFKKYSTNIKNARFPWYSKVLVLSAINGFPFPIKAFRWINRIKK